MSYVKLFESILDSTVWLEDLHVKVVWITMLAMKDADGIVHASIPGLAKRAGVTLAQCEESLAKFLGPDPYSSSKEHEGRRVAEVDGGWRVLNHDKYRDQLDQDDQRAKAAERMRRYRERRTVGDVTVTPSDAGDVTVRHTDPDQIQIRERGGDSRQRNAKPPEQALTLTSKSEKPKRAERKRSAEHPLPGDWKPDQTALKIAAELRLDVTAQATKFADWHAAKGSRFADWNAAFRNWLRNSVSFGQRGSVSPQAARSPMRSAPASEPMRFDLTDFDTTKGGG